MDYENDMGTPVFIHGIGNVNAHFELSFVIGDMVQRSVVLPLSMLLQRNKKTYENVSLFI